MTKLISLTSLARETWSIYKKKFNVLVGLMALPFALFIISPLLAQTEDFIFLPLSFFIIALAGLGLLWGGTAAVIVLDRREENLTIKEALSLSQDKLWPVVWVAIIACFITSGATALFIIPGLILAIYFLFAKIIVIVEGEKGMPALVKSREYLRDYFWPIVGRYLAIVTVSFLGLLILDIIASVFTESLSSVWGSMTSEIVLLVLQTIINIITFPLMMIPAYLLYLDVKKVKGDIVIVDDKKQGWIYLAVGLAGWVFLALLFVLIAIGLATAIFGYILGAFVTGVFNS